MPLTVLEIKDNICACLTDFSTILMVILWKSSLWAPFDCGFQFFASWPFNSKRKEEHRRGHHGGRQNKSEDQKDLGRLHNRLQVYRYGLMTYLQCGKPLLLSHLTHTEKKNNINKTPKCWNVPLCQPDSKSLTDRYPLKDPTERSIVFLCLFSDITAF